MPFENVEINLTASISNSTASFDPINHWDGDITAIPYLDFDGYSQISSYSDLDFEVFEFKTEINYYLTENLSLNAVLDYNKFTDDAPYVYGDQDGKWVYGRLGLKLFF